METSFFKKYLRLLLYFYIPWNLFLSYFILVGWAFESGKTPWYQVLLDMLVIPLIYPEILTTILILFFVLVINFFKKWWNEYRASVNH